MGSDRQQRGKDLFQRKSLTHGVCLVKGFDAQCLATVVTAALKRGRIKPL